MSLLSVLKKLMEVKEADVRDEIMTKMNKEGRKLAWLSEAMGVNYNTLYSILIHKTISLSDKNRKKINKALGTNF